MFVDAGGLGAGSYGFFSDKGQDQPKKSPALKPGESGGNRI